MRADLATTKQESSLKQTSSNKSSLNAKHININSNDALAITGSDIVSKEEINLNSNNLNINSSEDTLKYKSSTKSLTTGFGFTFYGGNSKSLELGLNDTRQSEQSLTNNNSHLYSSKDMNINTANDATIKGANLRADERLNLKVGNNLSLESTRDIRDASSKSKGINLSASYSGATNTKHFASGDSSLSSVGASISKSSSNTKIKQTNLSSITANELNVEVGNNTHLKGSLLAAGEYDKDNTFIDNHNLNLKTNTLSYENLSNTSYAKGTNFSIGANYAFKTQNDKQKYSNDKENINTKLNNQDKTNHQDLNSKILSTTYSNNKNLSYQTSKTLATIGKGNLDIKDKDNSDDAQRLNRDTDKINKGLYQGGFSSNIDASVDMRLFSGQGRKQIEKEFIDMDKNMATIAETLPDADSDNPIEATFGYIWNTIGGLTLGVLPTNSNLGGLLGSIPGYFGYEDSQFKVLGNPNSENAYVNGIMNTKKDALQGGKNIIGSDDFQEWYNPSRGFLADGIEFIVDKLNLHSGISKQLDAKQNEKDENGNIIKRNIFMHSQAHEVMKYGVNHENNYYSFGAPMRESTVRKIYQNPNGNKKMTVKQNPGDYVSKPENILNPKTWFMPGHGTENYGEAGNKKKKRD